jgi:hypothetical protein
MANEIGLTRWQRTGAVTLDRGPLSYSVRIDETWQMSGGSESWPEWEVFPASAWNYGLLLKDGEAQVSKIETMDNVADQPWTAQDAPIVIRVLARRVPEWTIGDDQTVQELPQSPVCSIEADEEIELVPMGCARLRISCLPAVIAGDSD